MFDLPFDLIQPVIPAAIPPAPPPETTPDKPDKPVKAKRKRQELKHLSEDEIARLFSVISSIRDRAIFQLAYRAGLRASEIGLLQLRDYDVLPSKDTRGGPQRAMRQFVTGLVYNLFTPFERLLKASRRTLAL